MKHLFLLPSILLAYTVTMAQSISDGLKYMDMEQYSKAGSLFNALAQSNPTAENLYYLGDYYLKVAYLDTTDTQELIDSAKYVFTKGKMADAKYPMNYVGLGAVKYLTGQWDSSKVYFETATKATKNKNAMVFYKIGEAYLYKGAKDAALAVPQLEKAVELDKSKNTDIILTLGDAYLYVDKGSASRAIQQYNKALSINPKLAKAHIKGGKIYLQARNYDEALKYYNRGIEADPDYSPAYRERAELYFKFKNYRDKAPDEYKKYLSMSDGNYKSKFRFAYFSYSVGDYNGALAQVNELMTEKPNDRILYRLNAYCNYEVGNALTDTIKAKSYFTNALGSMEKFFNLTSDTTKLIPLDYAYLGKLQIKFKNDSVGTANLIKSVKKDTTQCDIALQSAKELYEQKRYTCAARLFSTYYSYKTPTANDYLTWGRAYYNANDFLNADSVFTKLTEVRPDEPLGYKWVALTYAKQDPEAKSGVAVPKYEKFVEVANAKDAEKYKRDIISAYTYIGKYYLNAKKIPQSKEYWKKIIALDPNDPNAKMVLSSLK